MILQKIDYVIIMTIASGAYNNQKLCTTIILIPRLDSIFVDNSSDFHLPIMRGSTF